MKKTKIEFPEDPDFIDEHDTDSLLQNGRKKSSADNVSKPYKKTSLKNLTDEAIIEYMGKRKNMSELDYASVKTIRIPAGFWLMDPKSAALATAKENQDSSDRPYRRLEVNDPTTNPLPVACSIDLTVESERFYCGLDTHYFLRADPEKSYLAFTESNERGSAFDFRFVEMKYAEAAHLAQTIWWLYWVRSQGVFLGLDSSGVMHISSGGGKSSLIFRDGAGKDILVFDGASSSRDVREMRWSEDFNQRRFFYFADSLVVNALMEHLGEQWSRYYSDSSKKYPCLLGQPEYEQDELIRIQAVTETFLDLFSPDQTRISFAIVKESARVAGNEVFADLLDKLVAIQKRLRVLKTPERPKNLLEVDANNVKALKDAVALSIKKIRNADNLNVLQIWASSDDSGSDWALERLKEKDKKRYLAALEWELKNTKNRWTRQFTFNSITWVDKGRAVEIAKKIVSEKGDILVPASEYLMKTGNVTDESKWIETLIAAALNTESESSDRDKAIELLVPPDQPLRFPSREIDDALFKLMNSEQGDRSWSTTIGEASLALARRGRTEYFTNFVETLKKTKGYGDFEMVLSAIVLLSQSDPNKYYPQLKEIVKKQLKGTNSEKFLVMAIWSADLREFKSNLERISTSGPADYEDKRAGSCAEGGRVLEGNRFHVARKIVSLWNEKDLLTRCKLLLAFGLNDAYYYVEKPKPDWVYRMKTELSKMAKELTPDQKKQVSAFLDFYKAEHIDKEKEPDYAERRTKFISFAKPILGLQ